MQKKKWIIEIMVNALDDYGFVFVPDKYDKSKLWHFEREVGGITQRITLEDERYLYYGTKGRTLGLSFSTSAYGTRAPVSILKILPNERIPKVKIKADHPNKKVRPLLGELRYWVYDDEEGLKSILRDFVSLIKDYGLDKLTELSIEKEVVPTNEMGEKLMSSYEQLSEKFIQENQLDVTSIAKDNVLKWFDIVDQKIKEAKSETYQDVQEMLVEITAFLGEQLRIEVGGEWKVGIDTKTITIRRMNVFSTSVWLILAVVIGSWKHQDTNWLREEYFLFLDSKLPVTHEQMTELNIRRNELSSGKFKYPAL